MKEHVADMICIKHKYTVVMLVVLPLMIGVSCSPKEPAQLLQAVLEGADDKCQLPCWHGLVPGETTSEEFVSAFPMPDVSTSPLECQVPSQEPPVEGFPISNRCTWFLEDTGTDVGFDFGWDASRSLTEIDLTREKVSRLLYFDEVVATLGTPEAVSAARAFQSSQTCACPVDNTPGYYPTTFANFALLYASRGLIFFGSAAGEQWPCLCRNMLVYLVAIRPALSGNTSVESWFEDLFIFGTDPSIGTDYVRLGPFPGWGREIQDQGQIPWPTNNP